MIIISGSLNEINTTYNKHLSRIRDLLNSNYNEEAVILTVTIFEVYFRDLFRITREFWFAQYPGCSVDCLPIGKSIEARRAIRNYLKSIKAYEEFLGNYYVFDRGGQIDTTKDSLFTTLFDDEGKMNYLNFQLLAGTRGVREAYKLFYNIDIMTLLDINEKVSNQKWTKLNKLFDDRHEIVHKGKNTSFSKEEIEELLNSLDLLKSNVMKKIVFPFQGSIE